jgi:hypothetical protein
MTEHEAHYRRLFPNAGNPPRTITPSRIDDLRARVQIAEIRNRASAAGASIRANHHKATRGEAN